MNTHSFKPPYSLAQYHSLNIYTVAMAPAMEQLLGKSRSLRWSSWETFFDIRARDMDMSEKEKLKAAVCMFNWQIYYYGRKSCYTDDNMIWQK